MAGFDSLVILEALDGDEMIEYPMKVSIRRTLMPCRIERKEEDAWERLRIWATFLSRADKDYGFNVSLSS